MALTANTLIAVERRFAPAVGQGPAVFSPLERTRVDALNAGGDKMAPERNGYAPAYAKVLDHVTPRVIVELGVFQGVSMAMWCDLFPDADVVGLDLDFSRFREHRAVLESRGAFVANRPRLFEFDAYGDRLPEIGGIDLFIDDGPHTEEAIANTIRLVAPWMRAGGAYLVEDFAGGDALLDAAFPGARMLRAGRLSAALL